MNAPSHPSSKGRAPADYAIEHGEYLAEAAESFMTSLNDVATTEQALEILDEDDGPAYTTAKIENDRAWERRHDRWESLQNLIYEFRKRAERANHHETGCSTDADDAAKWRALRNCDRITAMGSAGIESADPYAHVTLNFWTGYSGTPGPGWAREWLDKFVAKAVRASPAKLEIRMAEEER